MKRLAVFAVVALGAALLMLCIKYETPILHFLARHGIFTEAVENRDRWIREGAPIYGYRETTWKTVLLTSKTMDIQLRSKRMEAWCNTPWWGCRPEAKAICREFEQQFNVRLTGLHNPTRHAREVCQ
jgi:hypothetical protein